MASVYYTECNVKNKNGGGVGTRLGKIFVCVQQTVNSLTTDEK